MLKIAYQLGVQKAFSEEDAARLVKEAQELGIDLEKSAFWATLGRGLMSGAQSLGAGIMGAGRTLGSGVMGAGRGAMQGIRASRGLTLPQKAGGALFGAKGHMGKAWGALSPAQRMGVGVAGGAGLSMMEDDEYPAAMGA